MKQIPLLQGKALLIELPGLKLITTIHESLLVAGVTQKDVSSKCRKIYKGDVKGFLQLPPGNWRIIGMLSEVTEEIATTVVKECIDACECTTGYVNYNRGDKPKPFCLPTALESLESAIESVGYYLDNNPIPPFHERKDDWMMAQERVLDRSRCLLLGREI